MTRDVMIALVTPITEVDEYGIPQLKTPRKVKVFAGCQSISQTEFFEAGRNGLKPEYKFTLFFGDYDGQKIVEYEGRMYSVYRTFLGKNDTIELYVQETGGTNG